jgi:hypothetical protein
VALEPGLDLGVLVGGVVVQDHVDRLAGRHAALDPVEAAEELLVPVPRQALADHRAVEQVERGEPGRRAVARVVASARRGRASLAGIGSGAARPMGHGAGAAR